MTRRLVPVQPSLYHLGLDLGTSPSHKARNDPIGTPELSHEAVSVGYTLLRQFSNVT